MWSVNKNFSHVDTQLLFNSVLDDISVGKKKELFHKDKGPPQISMVAMIEIHEMGFEVTDHFSDSLDLLLSNLFVLSKFNTSFRRQILLYKHRLRRLLHICKRVFCET